MFLHTQTAAILWLVPLGSLAGLPLLFAAATRRHRLLLLLVVAAWCLPFLIPLRFTLLRFVTVCALLVPTIRALQVVAGHENPRNYLEAIHLFSLPAVIRFQSTRSRDVARARRVLLVTGVHVAAIVALWWMVTTVNHPLLLIPAAQLGCYFMISVMTGVPVAVLALRGVDHDPPFRAPFLATTPAEFWGYRWNTWVNHLLHRYVFLPAGGKRDPVRGTFAAFAVSGVIHEAIVGIAALRLTGFMLLYFLLQAFLVVATSRSPAFRRLAKRRPIVARFLTGVLLLGSGTFVVAGALPIMRL